MGPRKVYDDALEAQIRQLSEQSYSSGAIADMIGKSRNSVISFCKRNKIKLHGNSPEGIHKRGMNTGTGVAARKLAIELELPVHEQCLWPDECQELKQSFKKPYCREHNKLAFVHSPTKYPMKTPG